MPTPEKTNSVTEDVLHPQTHTRLSAEEIAKAVARHNREHPKGAVRAQKPQKTTPRR